VSWTDVYGGNGIGLALGRRPYSSTSKFRDHLPTDPRIEWNKIRKGKSGLSAQERRKPKGRIFQVIKYARKKKGRAKTTESEKCENSPIF